MISPITHRNNAYLITELSVNVIINDYRDKYRMDVNRFYKNMDKLSLYECNDTGYRFFHPKELMGDGAFYDELLSTDTNYYSDWKREYQIALEVIESDSSIKNVLDIGCGSGKFLSKLPSSVHGIGLELSQSAVANGKSIGLDIREASITEHTKEHHQKYDVVCAFQVLEHIYDVKLFLDSCINSIKPGGKLILSVPNNTPFYSGNHRYAVANLPPHHIGLWNKESLNSLSSFYPIEKDLIFFDQKISIFKSTIQSSVSFSKDVFPETSNKLIYLISIFLSLLTYGVYHFFLSIVKQKKYYARVGIIFKVN